MRTDELDEKTLLKRLLEHADEVYEENDVNAFRSMLFRLENHGIHLTSRQREWADDIYRKCDIQRHYSDNLISGGKAPRGNVPSYEWENNLPGPFSLPSVNTWCRCTI